MQANIKTDAAEVHTSAAPVSLVTELTRQGVDGALATQRIMLDLIMRQNATTMNALRQTLSGSRMPKADGMTEMAAQGVANFIEAQRVLLNTALQGNEIVMTAVKERTGNPVIADLLRRSIDTFIDLQQHFLTIAERETSTWMDQAREGKIGGGKSMAELLEDSLDQFVRSQKKLLDMISEEMEAAEAKKGEEKKEPATGITDLMSQGAGALIQMNKKLLDVAGKQVDVNLKVAKRAVDALKPSMRFNPAELARQYADNLVAAQKSMLDIIVKPRPVVTARVEVKAEPRARRTRRTRTKRAKKAAQAASS